MGKTTVKKWTVPNEIMIPIGAEATRALKKCCDNWTDSEIATMRVKLPQQFHATPIEEIRRQCINLRKKGTDGFKVNGHGAAKGSRKKVKRQKPPKWYLDYINSYDWKTRRRKWLRFWKWRCCLCYAHRSEVLLDVHHRTYERIKKEKLSDCVVLCRRCHDLFETNVPEDQQQKELF